jgi:hypothetical protein
MYLLQVMLVVLGALSMERSAAAATCGNGTCEAGEDAANCAQDCLCFNNASEDVGLCCCCSNGPNPSGQCTPKAVCSYPEIGGCCCAQFDPADPFTCLVCVDKDPINNWCGGLGAFEGMGSCGPAAPTVCADTELTDDYVDGINVRTRCATLEFSLGTIEVGAILKLPVSMVYNEGRPPPSELLRGYESTAIAKTGPYGVGFWMSTDRIFTDEGIYWSNVDKTGAPVTQAVRMGTRNDRNGNGYVGYTLHTPFGSRTYDYPVVLEMAGKKVGAYRSEPFDGQFLTVVDHPGDKLHHRTYMLSRYPNGPYEIYEWSLSNTWGPFDTPPADVLNASLLSTVRGYFGPPKQNGGPGFEPKEIRIGRGRTLFPQGNGTNGLSNDTSVVYGSVDITEGWSIDLGDPFDAIQPDGGIQRTIKNKPGDLKRMLLMTQAAGYRLDTLTRPGRQGADLVTFGWDDWRLKSRDVKARDAALKTTYQSTATLARDKDTKSVFSVTRSEKILGVGRADEAILFESCNADGAAFQGTTVSFPRNVRWSFEYGDDASEHRLDAFTNPLGIRTQYLYNDQNTEPRGELTDSASLTGPTDPAMVAMGAGTHVNWDFVAQSPIDPALFPADTFGGAKTSKGVPVPIEVKRLPDGLTLQALSAYDASVFLPTSVVDDRGFKHVMSYYADTAQLKSYQKRGLTMRYVRTNETNFKISSSYSTGYEFLAMETFLEGPSGSVSVGKKYWDHAGRLFSDIQRGYQFDPADIGTGKTKPIQVEKRFTRGDFMKPSKLQTWIDDKLVAETLVQWDARIRGPSSASSSASGNAVASAAPVGMGTVDGVGSAVGSWEITAMGRKLGVTTELDPLGNILSASVNGLGAKIAYSVGAGGSLKVTTALTGAMGDTPMGETLESSGTTDKVCKP